MYSKAPINYVKTCATNTHVLSQIWEDHCCPGFGDSSSVEAGSFKMVPSDVDPSKKCCCDKLLCPAE